MSIPSSRKLWRVEKPTTNNNKNDAIKESGLLPMPLDHQRVAADTVLFSERLRAKQLEEQEKNLSADALRKVCKRVC